MKGLLWMGWMLATGLVQAQGTVAFAPATDLPTIMPPGWEQQPLAYASSGEAADVVVTLDQQLYPALGPLVEEWALKHKLKVRVGNGTCGISSGKLRKKAVDIGGFCCPPGPVDRLPGLEYHTIGIAGIAIITHADNTVDNISLDTARDIFSGDLERWYEVQANSPLGGGLLQPIARLHCKQRPGHWKLLLEDEQQFSPVMMEVGAIPDMIARVANGSGTVGYETPWMLEQYADRGAVKTVRIDGMNAGDAAMLVAGRYPLYRTYNITTWEQPATRKRHSSELVRFLLESASRIDPAYGIVPHEVLRSRGWRFNGDELVGGPG